MCVLLTPTSIHTLGEISSSRFVLHNSKICNKGSNIKYTYIQSKTEETVKKKDLSCT